MLSLFNYKSYYSLNAYPFLFQAANHTVFFLKKNLLFPGFPYVCILYSNFFSFILIVNQAPQKTQIYVSTVLGLPLSKVVCKTKRIGGGFGGKETRSAFICATAAVASYHLKRPVKITLDRDIDMMITGQRHSFLGKYKVCALWKVDLRYYKKTNMKAMFEVLSYNF